MLGVLGWSLVSHAEECDGKDSDGVPENEPAAQIGDRVFIDAFDAIDAAEAGDVVHICRGAVRPYAVWAAVVRSGVRLVGHDTARQHPILIGTVKVEPGASVELESLTFSNSKETLFIGAGAKVDAIDTMFEIDDALYNIVMDEQASLHLTGGDIRGGSYGISGGRGSWDTLPASGVHVILEDSELRADRYGLVAGDDSLIEGGRYYGGGDATILVYDTVDSLFTGATLVGARVESFGSDVAIRASAPVLIEGSEVFGDIRAPGLYTFASLLRGDVVIDWRGWWIATLTTVYGTVHLNDATVEGVNDTLVVSGSASPGGGGLVTSGRTTVIGMRVLHAGTDEGPAILVDVDSDLVFEGGEIGENHVYQGEWEIVPAINTTALALKAGATVELRDTFVVDNDSPAVVLQEGSQLVSECTWWGAGHDDNDFEGYYTPVDIVAGGGSWSFDFSDVWCDDSGCVSAKPTCYADPKAADRGDGMAR